MQVGFIGEEGGSGYQDTRVNHVWRGTWETDPKSACCMLTRGQIEMYRVSWFGSFRNNTTIPSEQRFNDGCLYIVPFRQVYKWPGIFNPRSRPNQRLAMAKTQSVTPDKDKSVTLARMTGIVAAECLLITGCKIQRSCASTVPGSAIPATPL